MLQIDTLTTICGIFLLGSIGWGLWTISDGQRQIGQMLLAMTEPKNRSDALKPIKELRTIQAEAEANAKARMDEAMRQNERAIEIGQRQVFLLEQILAELRSNRGVGEPMVSPLVPTNEAK
ncbi:hypothetical protein D3C86_887750 [compost metagenome]